MGKTIRSKTVIVIRWKDSGRIEVFVNLGGVFKKYSAEDLGVSRFTLDRKDLFVAFENEVVEIVKSSPQ